MESSSQVVEIIGQLKEHFKLEVMNLYWSLDAFEAHGKLDKLIAFPEVMQK
jgi:hypothetical protein